jgi:glycosyltransferase involved in cell wall biosynthesis
MKICFLATWTGAPHVQGWIRHFIEKREDVHLITHSREEVPGAKVYHLFTYRRVNFLSGPVQTAYLIKRIAPDIIHADLLTPYGFYAALSSFRPFIVSSRGSDALVNPKVSRVLEWMDRFVLKKADTVHSVGNHLAEVLASLGAEPAKIVTIPVGIDFRRFHPGVDGRDIRRVLGWEGNPIVISTRHFEPIYNLEQLLRAIPVVVRENNQVRFLIVGRGRQESYLKQFSNGLGIDPYVRFVGFLPQDQLALYLACADVYVSTSLSDGSSVSLLEGIACGCFPVVTDIPANREWVGEGENGFLAPVGRPDILAECIVTALKDRALRQRAKEKNWEIVQGRGSWDTNMERMEEMYRKLVW